MPRPGQGLRLWEGPNEIVGAGSWHALMLGIRFIRSMLAEEAARGAVFHPGVGEDAVNVEDLFILGETK